ncbi:MAG: PAS domain-containing protein [Gammaproteobacteria bacterium]
MKRADGHTAPLPLGAPGDPRAALITNADEITVCIDSGERVIAAAALDALRNPLDTSDVIARREPVAALFPNDTHELLRRHLADARGGIVRRMRLVPDDAWPEHQFDVVCQPLAGPRSDDVLLTLRRVANTVAPPDLLGIAPSTLTTDFETALEQVGIGWFERDLVDDVGICSRSAARMFGYARLETYDTQTLLTRVLPEDRAHLEAYFAAVRRAPSAEPATRILHYRINHPERGVRHIEARFRHAIADGHPRVHGLVIDVTDLQALEERLALAMREARLVPFEYDAATAMVAGPPLLAGFWPLAPAHGPWPLADVLAAVHPDERARLERLAAGDAADRGTVEFRLHRGNDAWHWFEARSTIERGDDGGVRRIRGIVIDIAARKAAELEVQEREERLRLTLAAADLNVWYLDLRARLLRLEPHIAAQLGAGNDAVPFDTFLNLVHGDDRAHLDAALRDLIGSRSREPRQVEYRLCLPDGSEVWADTRAGLVCDDDGEPIGVRGVSVDVSARRRADAERAELERQLAQAQRMEAIGMLTGGIAHDFNNIMASILGYTELARRRFASDESSRLAAYLAEIRTAGERARDMIRQMLAFSRGDSMVGTRIELELVVREAARLLRSVLPSSLELEIDRALDLASTPVDGVKLQQVVMNLCINARDATHGRGRLALRLAPWTSGVHTCASCHRPFDGPFTCLSVSDDGPGFDAETAARAFDPFFTTKAVGQGSGMGLAMVHGLVHDHGGHVLLETAPGAGSTVRVLLPCAADGSAPAAAIRGRAADRGGDFLVVDDEPELGACLAEALELAGLRAMTLTTGTAALERLRAEPTRWAALVTDLAMPDMSGIELVAAARRLRPDLSVIVVSAYSDTLDDATIESLGVAACLAKPLAPGALVEVARRCVEGL